MKKQRFLPYRQSIPALLLYRIVSFLVLQGWLLALSGISRLILRSAGRVAVTSGDLAFLFTSWQGILLVILALITLLIYFAVDINSLIILCDRLLNGQKPSVLYCVKEGFLSLRKFLNPIGFVVLIYLSVLSPVIGVGVSISLTRNFYIPNFISSVIYGNPLYLTGFIILIIALALLGFFNLFILHGALLDNKKLFRSSKDSFRLVKSNFKTVFLSLLIFSAVMLLGALAMIALLAVLTVVYFVFKLPMVFISVVLVTGFAVMLMVYSFALPFLGLTVTKLYYRVNSAGEWEYTPRQKRKSPLVIVTVIAFVLLAALSATALSAFADTTFPSKIRTTYIAHRAGGSEAPENTAAGVDAAFKFGASGSEIDIQRTSDGYYVVNHDDSFKRVAGVDKTSSEMTLAEVKALRVGGEPVATFEEMLDSSRDRVTLFVELKGATADKRMADDAVRIIKEKGMDEQAVIISLKYDLIEYIEDKYPDMLTGYLAFASFGDTAELSCDYIALEEESVRVATVSEIYHNGKKLLVWTVNDDSDIEDYLQIGADGIITDNIAAAQRIKEELSQRSTAERLTDGITRLFFSE